MRNDGRWQYLKLYYAEVNPENAAVMRFLSELELGKKVMDAGCGPSVMTEIAIARPDLQITMGDIDWGALDLVRAWLNNRPHAFDWNPHLLFSGKTAEEVRSCIREVMFFDLTSQDQIELHEQSYDSLILMWALEEISSSPTEFQRRMEILSTMTRKYLVLGTLTQSSKALSLYGTVKVPYQTTAEIQHVVRQAGFGQLKTEIIPAIGGWGYDEITMIYGAR